jgi:hypothetical protein
MYNLVELSQASTIVLWGLPARKAFRSKYGDSESGILSIAKLPRTVVEMNHPEFILRWLTPIHAMWNLDGLTKLQQLGVTITGDKLMNYLAQKLEGVSENDLEVPKFQARAWWTEARAKHLQKWAKLRYKQTMYKLEGPIEGWPAPATIRGWAMDEEGEEREKLIQMSNEKERHYMRVRKQAGTFKSKSTYKKVPPGHKARILKETFLNKLNGPIDTWPSCGTIKNWEKKAEGDEEKENLHELYLEKSRHEQKRHTRLKS